MTDASSDGSLDRFVVPVLLVVERVELPLTDLLLLFDELRPAYQMRYLLVVVQIHEFGLVV